MTPSQWRLILREYFDKNPEEKRVVAKNIGASVRSIDRWIEDGSRTDPERTRIPRLVKVVPGREAEMRLSLERDYPDAFERASGDELLSNIPSPFYARTVETLATTARNLARNTIMSTVMKQMAGHLDPDDDGILILFSQCIKPVVPGGRVTGLNVLASGYGTGRWQYRQVERSFIVGTGTVGAMAVSRGDMALFPQDLPDIDYCSLPIIHAEDLRSCAAFPVFREGDIAGALVVGAAQPQFFTETRRSLIKSYSYSFALALRDSEFYPISQIQLQAMPTIEHQSEIFVQSQRFLEDLALQYPGETIEQIEQRARDIFHEHLRENFKKEPTDAK